MKVGAPRRKRPGRLPQPEEDAAPPSSRRTSAKRVFARTGKRQPKRAAWAPGCRDAAQTATTRPAGRPPRRRGSIDGRGLQPGEAGSAGMSPPRGPRAGPPWRRLAGEGEQPPYGDADRPSEPAVEATRRAMAVRHGRADANRNRTARPRSRAIRTRATIAPQRAGGGGRWQRLGVASGRRRAREPEPEGPSGGPVDPPASGPPSAAGGSG